MPTKNRLRGRRLMKLREYVKCLTPLCPCGEPWTQLDHIVRIKDGGTDELENLQGLCFHCHEIKTEKDNRKWLLTP